MTTWKYLLGLLWFLCLSCPSEGDCKDYFDVERWKDHLSERVHLIATGTLKDQMKCASEIQCLQSGKHCEVFYHCFNRTDEEESQKCKGETPHSVSYYDYMCLTAKAIGHTVPHCNYTLVCKLYAQGGHDVCLKTTPPQSLTTTMVSTTTRPQMATTTTASAAPAETANAAATHITTDAIDGVKSNRNAPQGTVWATTVTVFLIPSLVLNVALLLWIFRLKCRRASQNVILSFEMEAMMDSRSEEPINERNSV